MAKIIEFGSKEFAIPETAKEHYDEEKLEEAKEMYSANDYEEWVTPEDYVAPEKVSKNAEKKIANFNFKKKKIGHGVLSYIFKGAA